MEIWQIKSMFGLQRFHNEVHSQQARNAQFQAEIAKDKRVCKIKIYMAQILDCFANRSRTKTCNDEWRCCFQSKSTTMKGKAACSENVLH